ncbi:hypothetical protein RI367_002909 [Sorochytrium milnesiophthora]
MKTAIIDRALDWPSVKELFPRREMEPATYIGPLLDILKIAPITKSCVAESVQSYTGGWLPNLEKLCVPRNPFLTKLPLTRQLRTRAGALAEAEEAIFNDGAPIDAVIQPLRNRRVYSAQVTLATDGVSRSHVSGPL